MCATVHNGGGKTPHEWYFAGPALIGILGDVIEAYRVSFLFLTHMMSERFFLWSSELTLPKGNPSDELT